MDYGQEDEKMTCEVLGDLCVNGIPRLVRPDKTYVLHSQITVDPEDHFKVKAWVPVRVSNYNLEFNSL
jgi:hypothetical protein